MSGTVVSEPPTIPEEGGGGAAVAHDQNSSGAIRRPRTHAGGSAESTGGSNANNAQRTSGVSKQQGEGSRKRISRACDQCNQLRTKCDGKQPCAHCIGTRLRCAYLRVPQKRGKASESYLKTLRKRAATKMGPSIVDGDVSPSNSLVHVNEQRGGGQGAAGVGGVGNIGKGDGVNGGTALAHPLGGYPGDYGNTTTSTLPPQGPPSTTALDLYGSPGIRFDAASDHSDQFGTAAGAGSHRFDGTAGSPSNSQSDGTSHAHSQHSGSQPSAGRARGPSRPPPTGGPHVAGTAANEFEIKASDTLDIEAPFARQSLGPSSSAFEGFSPWLQSPGVMAANAQVGGWFMGDDKTDDKLIPGTINGPGSTSSHSTSPSAYRGQLSPEETNAAAQGALQYYGGSESGKSFGDSATVPLGRRSKYPLLESVSAVLEGSVPIPLAEELLETYFSHSTHVLAYLVRRGSVLSVLRPRPTSPSLVFAMLMVAAHHSDHPALTGSPAARPKVIARLTELTIAHLRPAFSVTEPGTLDDVITYIQIATIVSASEHKGTSLRWWAIAWDLAKELKLNKEDPMLDAERREEQRRTWWLLYMVDRHLGLCYNRPLVILDAESQELYRPEDEEIWQSDAELTPPELVSNRVKGICPVVTGQGIYGYFLPLMSILGLLVDLHHLEQNTLLHAGETMKMLRSNVQTYLDQYLISITNWNAVPCRNAYENAWRDYAMQLGHVLQILYYVPWDPIQLLNSSADLMMSPEFGKIQHHAIAAVQSIRRILTVDPDLMLMPFFIGIYLLQGSFVLLAVVDQVQSDAPAEVVSACETIVRAHEVCIVTLNTEYQRNFRRIMRGTMSLLQADYNSAVSKDEIRRRQRDVLGLYSWAASGRGLAIQ